MNQLIDDINRYIAYLNRSGLFVTVHGKGLGGLLQHNIHRHPYCCLVKTDEEAWQTCIRCQQKVYRAHKQGSLFGMCHAGMEEYVFFVGDKTFVSVSGYGIHREKAMERIRRLTENYYLQESELKTVYENSLKHEPEDPDTLATVIRPLCHMLALLQLQLAEAAETDSVDGLGDTVLRYVQKNFMQELTIERVARACACSASTVSHLFRRHTGRSVKQYVAELRINQAKKLLETSDLPVQTVASLCGFANINYFSTAFKKTVGLSPTEYRRTAVD